MTCLHVAAFAASSAAVIIVQIVTVEIYPTMIRNSLYGLTSCLGRMASISTPLLMNEVSVMFMVYLWLLLLTWINLNRSMDKW